MITILHQLFFFLSAIYQYFREFIWKIHILFFRTVRLKAHKNIKLKLHSYGSITKHLFCQQVLVSFKKSFEYKTLELIRSKIKPDFKILDIGANIGLHSLVMANDLSDEGHIYSFEPSKKTYDALSKNVFLNNFQNKISTYNLALSNKNEALFLSAPDSLNIDEADKDAFNSLQVNQNKAGNAEKIQAVTLDSWIEKNSIAKIDLIKIDIEGAELLCFQGATEFFKYNNPIIIMECYEGWLKRFNHSIFDVLKFLNQFGYTFEEFGEYNWMAKKL